MAEVGETIYLDFEIRKASDGLPFIPTVGNVVVHIINVAGADNSANAAALGSSLVMRRTYVTTVAGTFLAYATTTDPAASRSRTQSIQFEVVPLGEESSSPWDTPLINVDNVGSMGLYLVNKLNGLIAGPATFTNPVDFITFEMTIVRGDDYTPASGRQIPTWANSDWEPMDLATAESVTFYCNSQHGTAPFSSACDVDSNTQVSLPLDGEVTQDWPVGRNSLNYWVEAILSGGEHITLALGKIHVVEGYQVP